MAETVYEYKKCGVAYLDILGFTGKAKDAQRLEQLAKALGDLEKVLSIAPEFAANTHMFSDTIVVTFPDVSQISGEGIKYLSILQFYSALRGLFLRGGIAHGDHYEKGIVMFGPAYLNAYELEGTAMWPRVLIHPSVLRLDPGPFDWAYNSVRDDLGLPFVNYLNTTVMAFMYSNWESEYKNERLVVPWQPLLSRHRAAILKEVAQIDEPGLLAKYHALAAYHNSVVRTLVSKLHEPLSIDLINAFMTSLNAQNQDEKASVSKHLDNKMAQLPREKTILEMAIINLPASFPALYGSAG